MATSEIKRRAHLQNPALRMGVDNTRTVLRLLTDRGIVRRVRIRKQSHPRYELTQLGRNIQELLFGAERVP